MPVQTIRRKIDTETYEDLASGDRSFVVCTTSEDVQPDDYFVFVETAQPHNREVYRKVTLVVEVEGTDVLIAGLVPVEYQALESLFKNNNIVMAYGVEKHDNDISIIEQPSFLPLLAAPTMNLHQTNDFLGIDTWPIGQYSIMLKCAMTPVEDGRQDITVTEHLVMCRTQREHEDEQLDIFIQVDHRFLLVGKLKDIFGNEVVAHTGPLGGDQDGDYEFDDEYTDEADVDGTEETEPQE